MPKKTTFSYNFKPAVSYIHPSHSIPPKSAFCPSLVPKTPLECAAQVMHLHREEAEIYDAHPNKRCLQVNKTAENKAPGKLRNGPAI